MSIEIRLTKSEATILHGYLTRLVGKGSMATSPAWARKIAGKIKKAELEKGKHEESNT